jgi:tetrahydromethanopterin S-methyltransferase subunit G
MSTTKLERENLEAHVDLCAERYKQLEMRLGSIETKVEILADKIQQSQTSITKVMIGTAGTIVAGVISTIVVILMN